MEKETVTLFGEKYTIARPEKEFSPRRYQMVITDVTKKPVVIPIKDRNGKLEAKSCLSNLDFFTTKFKDKKELLRECKRQGLLILSEGNVEITYSPSKRKKPISLSIAYQDDFYLTNFMLKDRNEARISQSLIDMVSHLFIDFENKTYRNFLMHSNFLKQDLLCLLHEYPFHYRALKGEVVSDFEQSQMQEQKRKTLQNVFQYFGDSYKRVRGLYFANKEFHRLYPNILLEEDRIESLEIENENTPIITEFMIDPNDPFEHPEVEREVLPEENITKEERSWEGEQLNFSDYDQGYHGGRK